MTDRTLVVELAHIEAAHLARIVAQFVELLADTLDGSDDPAVARLVPSAYRDDEDAAREFRELTQDDLLDRRRDDASAMLASLADYATVPEDATDDQLTEAVTFVLSASTAQTWLRTLAAVRLVMASRLGIDEIDEHDHDDPRYGVYEWLGYRLDGLVQALDD